jgi:hypothetical protein
MEERKERVRKFYQDKIRDYYEIAYNAYLNNNHLDERPLYKYEIESLLDQSNRSKVPKSVTDAFDFYYSKVEEKDLGSVWVYKVEVDGKATYAIRVSTDGDDGWLELFDQDGENLGSARTYIEIILWGEINEIRSQAENWEFPPEFENRKQLSLWKSQTS